MADLKKLLNLPTDIDEKSTLLLLKAIKNHNKEGFDYLEFIASVDKLKELNMDETTAIKSAFATASSFGLTKETLVSSGHYYIGVLRREYDSFKSALSRQIEKKIGVPTQKIQAMEKDYLDIDNQIDKLLKRKEKYKTEIEKLKQDITQNRTDLTSREERFNDTFNRIKERIEDHINNITDQL